MKTALLLVFMSIFLAISCEETKTSLSGSSLFVENFKGEIVTIEDGRNTCGIVMRVGRHLSEEDIKKLIPAVTNSNTGLKSGDIFSAILEGVRQSCEFNKVKMPEQPYTAGIYYYLAGKRQVVSKVTYLIGDDSASLTFIIEK